MEHHNDYSHEQNDADLVACVLAGDRDAFDILFQRHAPGVQRLCSRLLGPTVEAQDVVQEAALQAFLGLSHLREPARFAAWFHAIAANLARLTLRRRREHSLQALGEEIMVDLARRDSPPTLEEYLFEREMQEAITQAIQQLPPAYRQVVVGFYLQGYRYEELAELLGISVSTLKWRLFEGRKLLKPLLQPQAETLLYPVENQPRKEKPGMTEDLVTLHVDSLRRLPFARWYLAILRDPASRHVVPVPLTETEFNGLEIAFRLRQDTDALSVPQDLSQRLLESFGAHLQQVVIHVLAGQTLYATATFKQGARVRSVDMRLAEALVLAVREDVPISITRTLFEARAALDLTGQVSPASEEELLARGKSLRKLGREERLQWEEAVLNQYLNAERKRPELSWERLWSMLLISLTGSAEGISVTELQALDLTATFSPRQVIWEAEPMIAIRVLDQSEESWLLVPPVLWEKVVQQWQALRDSEQGNEQAHPVTGPISDVLTPRLQQQAEAMLGQLVELPEVRTAFLLNPAGNVAAWKGPETREDLQRYCATGNDILGPFRELERENVYQGQKVIATLYAKQRPPEQGPPELSGTGRMLVSHRSGWRLVVFYEKQRTDRGKAQAHRRIEEAWQEFTHLLAQQEPD